MPNQHSISYTQEQIDFVFDKVSTLSWKDLTAKFNKKFKTNRTENALRGIIRRYPDMILPEKESKYQFILQKFVDKVKSVGYVPKITVFFRECNIHPDTFRKYFDSYETLERVAKEKYPKVFESIVDESKFTEEAFVDLNDDLKTFRRFVITAAVTGCQPHQAGLKSLQNYCRINNAKLLILPCSDPAKTVERKYNFSLHQDIPNDSVVFRDLNLNSNLLLSTIKLSAKQLNPLTGLIRLGYKGSMILASPKQMLQHVSNSNKQAIPRAIMTTGAITEADYRTDLYMSERTAYLANEDHTLGAIVVELLNDRLFFYRRIQINQDGTFCDLNKKYSPKKVEKVTASVINQPDWHVGETDPEFAVTAMQITDLLKPDYVTFEDFFDGGSINPHETNNVVKRAIRGPQGMSLREELENCAKQLRWILSWGDFKVVMKYGNHEDFLKRWLSTAEYAKDHLNHYFGVVLAKALLEGNNPFEFAMRQLMRVDNGPVGHQRIKFLDVNDSFILNGIENGAHGHLGSGGKKNPGLVGMESYGACTVGHSHSAAIFRNVVRVGTATKLQLPYNDGASAWTQTLCIQHHDGARQLITVIDGRFCLDDILE